MSDLIKALIQVKDPLTLAAFFSAVLLLAFRTRKVPEMFFGLLKEKLTKERFAQVLHRFMVLGFSSLCVLCAVATNFSGPRNEKPSARRAVISFRTKSSLEPTEAAEWRI